jgi:rubrerythrin
MQAEKDSILYYHELLSHAPYPEAKELIRKVIVEEGKHLTFLYRKMLEAGAEESG